MLDSRHGPVRNLIVLRLEPQKYEGHRHPIRFICLLELPDKPGADEGELECADQQDAFEVYVLKQQVLQTKS